jgi:hypothetical protein
MVQKWMKFFENIGENFYLELYLKPTWKKFDYGKTPEQSAALFLSTYAFERQGADPSYAPAACDTVQDCKDVFGQTVTEAMEKKLWKDFVQRLRQESLNKERNPLYYEGSQWPLLRVMREGSLVETTRNLLVKNNAREAFDFMCGIRGVGPKISSFFLRDLKEAFRINQSLDDRELLQPIDIWVRRTIQHIRNDRSGGDKQIAKFIVENSKNPELVNMGIWLFAAVICRSRYKHTQCLQDLNIAQRETKNYLADAKNICSISLAEI